MTEGFSHLAADLTSRLQSWRAPDASQESLRLAYLDHLARYGAKGVAKAGPPEHVTASCLVIAPGLDEVLLTLHAKAGLWFQMGGHLEETDADVPAAALREAVEESGLARSALRLHPEIVQLDRHRLVGRFGRCTEHLDVRMVAVAERDAPFAVSSESLDVAWWPVDALPAENRDEMAGLVAAARSALA